MTAIAILTSFLAYTALLFIIMFFTSRKSDNRSFFIGNKQSPWYIVAYGMISATLSGITFMSVPGLVVNSHFSYMMIVFGYFFGYLVIIYVLLPLYYKLNLTSIYTYLNKRFGFWSYKTGAFFFLVSRSIGASFRMFLVVNVLQIFVFDQWDIPFTFTVAVFMVLMVLYTFKGGIKTIVWTDTLQTTFMILSVVLSIVFITKELGLNFNELVNTIAQKDYSKIIYTDWQHERNYIKQFLSGIFITIVMTGLDQDMMQKNLSCKNLKDAQKNMFTFGTLLIPINFIFLSLGVVLLIYANANGISYAETTDNLFPTIALKHLAPAAGIVFLIGLISAAYSSADSALTALTTSFCIDFLRFEEKKSLTERQKTITRTRVHIGFAFIVFLIIVGFKAINDEAILNKLFTIAGYTYGPLLGLYSFGLFTKLKVKDQWIPFLCLVSPALTYIIKMNSQDWFNGYTFGFELLLVNGFITFAGLLAFYKAKTKKIV